MNLDYFIRVAVEEAVKSDYKINVGCVIFDKGKLISKGHNCRRHHRNLHPNFYKYRGEIHAEMNAIINAKRDLKNTSILVVRVNNQNQLRLSRPCSICMGYIDYIGFKNIFYSESSFPYITKL